MQRQGSHLPSALSHSPETGRWPLGSHEWGALFGCAIRKFDLQKVTFQKAREHSVKTARLPIQEHMVRRQNEKNYHSEILAINQGTAHMIQPNMFFFPGHLLVLFLAGHYVFCVFRLLLCFLPFFFFFFKEC